MHSRGMRTWGVPRALTALVIALLATATALRVFLAESGTPDSAGVQFSYAGSQVADSYGELPETAQPAAPSITIQTDLERTANVARYLAQAGGLSAEQAVEWASKFRLVARSDLLRKGHPITVYTDPETGELRGFKYDVDDRVAVLEANLGGGIVKAYQQPIRYFVRPISLAFELRQSFRSAATKNHVPASVIDTLEDAFSAHSDLEHPRLGTAVKLIYSERVSRDGKHRIAGNVDAAEIHYGMHSLEAFGFRDEHGRAHLYDEEGHALGPQFLRFPVNFDYISSGFTLHRYHPILHQYRPHVGVDLAAQYGTPVKAIADGRVESEGWCGELGNCIRLDHENATVSIYGHLSRINSDVRPGSYIKIGQVIGNVGSTGLSTGPHLHFAIEKRGSYINPLTDKLGVHHEVSPRMAALFQNLKKRYQTALAKLPSLGSHFVPAIARKPAISPLADMYHVKLTMPRTKTSARHHRRVSTDQIFGSSSGAAQDQTGAM